MLEGNCGGGWDGGDGRPGNQLPVHAVKWRKAIASEMKDWEACRAAAIVTPEGETNSKAPHNWQVDFPWRHLSFPWPLACHSAPIAFSFTSSRLMSRMAFFCGNVCTFVGRVIELQEHSNWRLSPPMERFNSPIKAKSTQRCKSLSPN